MVRVDSVRADYYNAQTKNGNPYRRTNTGKKIATLLGLGTGGYISYNAAKVMTAPGSTVLKTIKTIAKSFPMNIVFAKSLAAWTLGGLLVGAVADFAVNKIRKNKADKNDVKV